MEPRIFNRLQAIAAESDASKKAQMKAESKVELGEWFARHPHEAEELAFDLFSNAFADAADNSVVNQLIDVKRVGLAETDFINEDLRGLRAYTQGKGGQILSDILRYERAQMPREEMVAAIDIHRDEIQTNFWGTLDALQAQARAKLEALPTQRLVELLQAAITAGAYYGSFPFATISSANVDPIIESVMLNSEGQVNLVGTQVAIRRLSNLALDYGPNLQEKVFATGQIASYKGTPIVQVENFQNFEGYWVLPHDEIWVVGKNAGRLTYYGDTPKVQQLPQPSFWTRWETARDYGMLLHGVGKGRLGRFILT
jgi:hypothetical protein